MVDSQSSKSERNTQQLEDDESVAQSKQTAWPLSNDSSLEDFHQPRIVGLERCEYQASGDTPTACSDTALVSVTIMPAGGRCA